MAVRIHLLGQVSLESDTTIVPASALPGRQGRLTLAYLTLAAGPVPRDQLADVVWSDVLPKSWERDLSAVISKLKGPLAKVGAAEAIHSALGCYELSLPPGTVVDVDAVRRNVELAEAALRREAPAEAWGAASTAAHLARRPFLPGESGSWVERVRRELASLLVRAADALVVVEAGRGRWAEAVRYAEEAIGREPFRESGYVALVDVHVAAGNRAEALRTYERARALLAEELGVPPSAPLEAAYRRALEADAPTATPARAVAGTVTLVFTDLVDSTAMLDRLPADEAEALRRVHFRLLRDAVATTGGHEVKNLGDGLMLVFGRARDALTCAVAIQEAVERHNREGDGPPLAIRVGVHLGEPTVEDGDYFGMPVVVAKRLCDRAEGGEILVSDLACTVAGAAEGFDLGPLEALSLKGLEAPVPARRLRWSPVVDAPLALPALVRVIDPQFAFVGRDREVERLLALVGAAAQPELVLVSGEPGVGKTRLLAEVARRAHADGATVLWGRCSEEPLAAYQPFVEALDHVVEAAPVHELRVLVGQGASELARIVPRVAERLPSVERGTGSDDTDRLVLFDAVTRCVVGLAASRPVVLVLDDLHWADAPTMQVLVHLLRRPEAAPVAVLASTRASRADWSAEATSAFADVVRTERLAQVALAGLDEPAVSSLLELDDRRMHPEGFAFARSLRSATGGNPFFIREVLRQLIEAGELARRDGRWVVTDPHRHLDAPSGVASVVGRRVARLGEPAREVLTLASVIGSDFDVPLLAELAQRTADEVLDLLDEAVDAALIVEPQGGIDRFSFTHAIVRDALHDQIGASRRGRLHRRVAEAIERLGLERSRLAALAHHWCAAGPAGDLARAAEVAEQAGAAALQQLAYEDAANHFAAALAAVRQAVPVDGARERSLLLRLGDAHARGADRRAATVYREAIDAARAAGDPVDLARGVLGLTDQWALTGLVDDERIALLEAAIDGLEGAEVAERAMLLGQLAGELYYAPESVGRRDDLSAEAVEVARRIDDPVVLGNALDRRNYATWGPDGAAARLEAGREIIRLAREASSPELELRGHDWVMLSAGPLADLQTYDEALAAFERLAEELRRPRHQWYARTRRAGRTSLSGDLDEGSRLARLARAAGDRLGEPDTIGVFCGSMWPVWLERPDDEGLQTQWEVMSTYIPAEPGGVNLPHLIHRAMGAVLSALLGDLDTAAGHLEWYRRHGLDAIPRDYGWGITVATLCRLAALVGTEEDAAELYDLALPYDGQMVPTAGSVWCGAWSQLLGGLAARLGRAEAASDHLQRGRALYERIGAKAFLARSELELAQLGVAGATELARAALATAEAIGLPLIARDAAALLSRPG